MTDRLAVCRAGGPRGPILWVHGYTLDSSIWRDVWLHLPDWAHIAVDLPGHGHSPPLSAGTDLPMLGRQLAELALAERAQHIVGLSFGAKVALQAAIEAPGAFATLVLCSPPLVGDSEDLLTQARSRFLARLYKERGVGPWMTEAWMRWPPDIFKGASRYPALWDTLRAAIDRHKWQELEDHRMRPLFSHGQSLQDLQRVRAAALIVIGENDMASFKRSAEILRRSIKDAVRIYASDAGHLSVLESPSTTRMIGSHLGDHDR